jgi:maltodextrin utilization protein YvdJ
VTWLLRRSFLLKGKKSHNITRQLSSVTKITKKKEKKNNKVDKQKKIYKFKKKNSVLRKDLRGNLQVPKKKKTNSTTITKTKAVKNSVRSHCLSAKLEAFSNSCMKHSKEFQTIQSKHVHE